MPAAGQATDAQDLELLIQALRRPDAYPHAVRDVQVMETHISWILLAGEFAYKIKKAVNLGFLDFSTLAKRHHFCLEELRLNRRLVPSLYLEVTPIYGALDKPSFRETGEPLEYAVKMRRFPQTAQLDRMLEAGAVHAETMDALAAEISRFHGSIPVAAATDDYSTPERVIAPARENFEQILPLVHDPGVSERIESLRSWSEARYEELFSELAWRKRHGYVRECHGDLHLSNLVQLENRVTAFDCIEFNPALRWIDVIDDTAFLMMDLQVRKCSDLAFRFMNVYLEHTGDYRGLRLLRFYIVYRSLVRAKVAALRAQQGDLSPSEMAAARARFDEHVRLAERLCESDRPMMLITHGLSGSGKTWLTHRLAPLIPAFWIRSDIERKRLHGLGPGDRSESGVGTGLYTAEANQQTYGRLAELAEIILRCGYTVVVDAAFLHRGERREFRHLASALEVPYVVLWCQARESCLRQRLRQRRAKHADASEATAAVLDYQLVNAHPLGADEQAQAVKIDTGTRLDRPDLAKICEEILRVRTTQSTSDSLSKAGV